MNYDCKGQQNTHGCNRKSDENTPKLKKSNKKLSSLSACRYNQNCQANTYTTHARQTPGRSGIGEMEKCEGPEAQGNKML